MYQWENRQESDDNVCSFSNKAQNFEGQSANPASIFVNANRFLRVNKIDVCFCYGYWPLPAVGVLAACMLNRIPAIVMSDSHQLSQKTGILGRILKKVITRQFDAAFVGGRAHVQFFEQLGIRKGKAFYGWDIIDNQYFASRAAQARANDLAVRKRLGLPPKYVLSLGRMVQKKNLPALVKAYAMAKRSGKLDAELVFLGTGEMEQALREQAKSEGLVIRDKYVEDVGSVGSVCFFHHQALEDLPSFYALAEAFVLPSQSEEWGLVVNEAMACGIPVIVSSRCGCAADLAHHGINGYQFDCGNPEELSGRLVEICSQPTLVRKMGESSLSIISKWNDDFFLKNAQSAIAAAMSGYMPN